MTETNQRSKSMIRRNISATPQSKTGRQVLEELSYEQNTDPVTFIKKSKPTSVE